MNSRAARPLLVDTSALYARFVPDAPRHDRSMELFSAIRDGEHPYRPLYTPNLVCSELATLLLRKAGHAQAVECLDAIRSSELIEIVHPDAETFEHVCASFRRYDDQQISFVDHSIAILARRFDVNEVFTFDDDFRTFELSVVPYDL